MRYLLIILFLNILNASPSLAVAAIEKTERSVILKSFPTEDKKKEKTVLFVILLVAFFAFCLFGFLAAVALASGYSASIANMFWLCLGGAVLTLIGTIVSGIKAFS